MVLHIREDGSGESALAQAVAQHRAGFAAGLVQPLPAEAATEVGADPDPEHDVRGPMQMLAAAIATCAIAATAVLLWPSSAPPKTQPKAVPSLGVWA